MSPKNIVRNHAPHAFDPAAAALIACRVLESEIVALTSGRPAFAYSEWFDVGLHDAPVRLRESLAGAIARAEENATVTTILLAYGLCGCALVGLTPQRATLIIPRAHDCLTLLLGSKERYARIMHSEPGTYWYSPGWNREQRVPGPEREAKLRVQYTQQFGAEEAEALLEMEREAFGQHSCAGYTDLGLPGDDEQRRYAERCAQSLGWTFRRHPGDPALLSALLSGNWDDDRFLRVRPGQRIGHSVDDAIIRTEPVSPVATSSSQQPQ